MTQGGVLQNACAIHAPSRPAPGRRGVRNSHHVSQRNAYRWNGPAAIAGGSAISASPDGKEPVLKPPSTVTGVPPAGDGVDTKGSRNESAAQQGSSPEDATAEAAHGSKTDSLADASGKAARSKGETDRQACSGASATAAIDSRISQQGGRGFGSAVRQLMSWANSGSRLSRTRGYTLVPSATNRSDRNMDDDLDGAPTMATLDPANERRTLAAERLAKRREAVAAKHLTYKQSQAQKADRAKAIAAVRQGNRQAKQDKFAAGKAEDSAEEAEIADVTARSRKLKAQKAAKQAVAASQYFIDDSYISDDAEPVTEQQEDAKRAEVMRNVRLKKANKAAKLDSMARQHKAAQLEREQAEENGFTSEQQETADIASVTSEADAKKAKKAAKRAQVAGQFVKMAPPEVEEQPDPQQVEAAQMTAITDDTRRLKYAKASKLDQMAGQHVSVDLRGEAATELAQKAELEAQQHQQAIKRSLASAAGLAKQHKARKAAKLAAQAKYFMTAQEMADTPEAREEERAIQQENARARAAIVSKYKKQRADKAERIAKQQALYEKATDQIADDKASEEQKAEQELANLRRTVVRKAKQRKEAKAMRLAEEATFYSRVEPEIPEPQEDMLEIVAEQARKRKSEKTAKQEAVRSFFSDQPKEVDTKQPPARVDTTRQKTAKAAKLAAVAAGAAAAAAGGGGGGAGGGGGGGSGSGGSGAGGKGEDENPMWGRYGPLALAFVVGLVVAIGLHNETDGDIVVYFGKNVSLVALLGASAASLALKGPGIAGAIGAIGTWLYLQQSAPEPAPVVVPSKRGRR